MISDFDTHLWVTDGLSKQQTIIDSQNLHNAKIYFNPRDMETVCPKCRRYA